MVDTKSGLSLLETLVGGLLLCVAFFVVISLYPASLLGMRQGRQWIDATDLAQQLIEERRHDYDKLQNLTGKAERGGVEFIYQIAVTNSPDGTPDVRRLQVDVSWKDGRVERRKRLETRIFHWRNP